MLKSIDGWRAAFRIGAFRDQFLITVVALPVTVVILRVYLDHIEVRGGVNIPDPLLSLFAPVDLNWVIFAVLYSGLLLGLVSLALYPFRFLLAMRALTALILLRIASLFLFPLDTIPGGIPLDDPIVRLPALRFTGSHGLFFCWETAVLTLLILTARWRDVKIIFVCATVVLSILLILQRAQYSIALVAGPCFAYVAYGFARYITVRDISEVREFAPPEKKTTFTVRNN